jgi:hypothetical protein
MNYIKQLEADLAESNQIIYTRNDRVQELLEHLASAKFYSSADGDRADWIAVADVRRWLQYIAEPVDN